jgi:hypothetical protein
MSKLLAFILIASGIAFAQSAEEYCSTERTAGESCYMQCCQSLGYSWDGGCMVSEDQQASVSSACGYCTDTYMQCVSDYESGNSGGSSSSGSGGGCCGAFIFLPFIAGAAIYRNHNQRK